MILLFDIKKEVNRRYLRTLKATQSQLFDDLGRVFNGPKVIDITIAKSYPIAIAKLHMHMISDLVFDVRDSS